MIREIDYQPIVVDFALSKNLDFAEVARDELTPFAGDWDLFPHLNETHPLKKMREGEKGSREEIFKLAFPTLDLFDFGMMLKNLTPQLQKYFDERDCSYLLALTNELTDWEAAQKWDSKMLEDRISRLSPEQYSVFGVPELTPSTSAERTVMLPPDIGIPLTPEIERILDNRSFRRLNNINQLAMLPVIYPGADYKRSVHVLYSYHLARQFCVRLYSSPLFRLYVDQKSCQRLLATVLTHDINHFPFLHIFQEAKLERLSKIDLFDFFSNGEATGERALRDDSLYDLLAGYQMDPALFKRLVFSDHSDQRTPVDQIINSFVSSGADMDKMSYLFLDGYFSGVRFGAGIDYSGLLKSATIGKVASTGHLHLAFSERGIQAEENLAMTRYWNFRSLYWHHTNRSIMAMILHVVRSLYLDKEIDVKRYLLDTLWMSDLEALKYLDARYREAFYKPSILQDFPHDRRRVFKRLYTVRAGGHDEADNALHRRLHGLSYIQEVALRKAVARNLMEYLPSSEREELTQDDVLIDIPRRDVDSGGKTYIAPAGGGPLRTLDEVSKPIGAISANYQLLTKRIRFFISPRLAKAFPKGRRDDRRKELHKMISAEMDRVASQDQIA